MAETFFTSDTHFGHTNVLKYTDRHKLWQSVEEMNESLIERWNSKVKQGDIVYHLGDVMWLPKRNAGLLDRLNGSIILIAGNHDSNQTLRLNRFKEVHNLKEIRLDGEKITLCHYKMHVWNKAHYGALQFYGHSHGSLPGDNQCCDVGVDNPAWDYSPANLDEIREFLRMQPERKPVDHHV